MNFKDRVLKNANLLNEDVDIVKLNKNGLQDLINSLKEISKSLDIIEEYGDEFIDDSMFKARTIQINDFVKSWNFKVKGMKYYFSDIVNGLHRKQHKK